MITESYKGSFILFFLYCIYILRRMGIGNKSIFKWLTKKRKKNFVTDFFYFHIFFKEWEFFFFFSKTFLIFFFGAMIQLCCITVSAREWNNCIKIPTQKKNPLPTQKINKFPWARKGLSRERGNEPLQKH